MRQLGENMESMEQLQIVVGEIQAIRQQIAGLKAQTLELEATSEAVKNQPENLALHQQLGGVLIEVADRTSLHEVLIKDIESINEHMIRFETREKELVSSYEELKKVLEGSQ